MDSLRGFPRWTIPPTLTHLDLVVFLFQVIKAFIADAYATTSLPQAMAFRYLEGRPGHGKHILICTYHMSNGKKSASCIVYKGISTIQWCGEQNKAWNKDPSLNTKYFHVQISGRVFFLLAPIKTGHLQLGVLPIRWMDFYQLGAPFLFSKIFCGKKSPLLVFLLAVFFESNFTSPNKDLQPSKCSSSNLRIFCKNGFSEFLRSMNCPGEAAGTASLGCKVVA